MAKRLLAVLAAAALIVGAILARSAIDRHGSTSSGGPGLTTTAPATRTQVWCLEDLRVACEAAFGGVPSIALSIDTMGAAIARLSAARVDDDLPDAWVTFAPLPAMAKDAVARAGGPAASVDTSDDLLATTRLVIATRADRAPILAAACPPPFPWKCIGTNAGKKWTDIGGPAAFQVVKPAFGDPTTSATALMVWASAVGHYLGRDVYTGNDVEADDGFLAWGRNLRAADPDGGAGDPLADLALGRVQRDVVGSTEAAVSRASSLAVVGEPYGRVDVVVTGFAGTTSTERLRSSLVTALTGAGWTPADATTPPASRPSATTYVALQTMWKDLG